MVNKYNLVITEARLPGPVLRDHAGHLYSAGGCAIVAENEGPTSVRFEMTSNVWGQPHPGQQLAVIVGSPQDIARILNAATYGMDRVQGPMPEVRIDGD